MDAWNLKTFLDVLQGNFHSLKLQQNSYFRIIYKDNHITYDRLQRLDGNDYDMLIKDHKYRLGEMIDFRMRHQEWKKTLVNEKNYFSSIIVENNCSG